MYVAISNFMPLDPVDKVLPYQQVSSLTASQLAGPISGLLNANLVSLLTSYVTALQCGSWSKHAHTETHC